MAVINPLPFSTLMGVPKEPAKNIGNYTDEKSIGKVLIWFTDLFRLPDEMQWKTRIIETGISNPARITIEKSYHDHKNYFRPLLVPFILLFFFKIF